MHSAGASAVHVPGRVMRVSQCVAIVDLLQRVSATPYHAVFSALCVCARDFYTRGRNAALRGCLQGVEPDTPGLKLPKHLYTMHRFMLAGYLYPMVDIWQTMTPLSPHDLVGRFDVEITNIVKREQNYKKNAQCQILSSRAPRFAGTVRLS